MGKQFFAVPKWKNLILAVLILLGLYLSSLYNFLLFHSLAEIFSIVVAWSIFIIAWNSRKLLDHSYFLFIGIAYFFIGSLDLVHTLAYSGMGIFHGYDSNLPAQLWIAARFVESISLLAAPFFLKKRGSGKIIFWSYTFLFIIFLFLIFSRVFPDCFIEGTGLTLFKKTSEYIIIMILASAIIILSKRKDRLDPAAYRLLVLSICLTICAELSFTFYIHVYGFSNLVGHYLKILSFYCLYKAIFETGFIQPYDLLSRNFKKTQIALKEDEERYKGLFLNMGAGVAIYEVIGEGQDFVFMDLNRAGEKLENQKKNAIIGKSVFKVRSGVEQFGLIDVFREVWKTGKPQHYPIRLYKDEILEAWFENFVYKLPTGEIVAIYTDETKKQCTRAALEKSERMYRSLIDEMVNGFSFHEIICDKEGNPCDYRFLQVNKAFEKMTCLKAKNIIGKRVLEVLPETEQYWIDNFGKVALTGKPMGFENFAKELNKYFEVLAYSPEIGQFAVVFTDITRRRMAEKALLESETKYRSMMKTLKHAVYICSSDLNIKYMNPAMIKKTGFDATGRTCYQALYGLAQKCSWCVMDQVQKGENIDYELADPKNKLFYQVSNAPMVHGSNSIAKLSILHDITQQKLNQDALINSAEQLRQFALRLTYMEEAEKTKLALELHDRVGQNLTALNINLSIIKNLLSHESTDRVGDRLSDSMALTEDIFKQVRDVMVDLRPEALDDYGLFAALGMYCEKFETRYNIRTQIKGCEFTHRLESKMETALFRIVQEAMTNSARHARADKIILIFESTDTYDRLTIKDNGTGFDPARLNRNGLDKGWGLTIMEERASAIGMDFQVESGQSHGTKIIMGKKRGAHDD